MIAAFALVTILIAATAILAQRGKQKTPPVQNHTEQVQNASQPAGELLPESLTSPSLWSKEYIHGPGGKVIATEERLIFTDVDEGSDFCDDIYRIAARGVTVGCGGGSFCADQNVTREQMAAFIMRAKGEFSPPTPPTQRFNDVPPANAFYNFIEKMGALDIWHGQGCPGTNNYCPTAPVTRRQMAHILVRAFGI